MAYTETTHTSYFSRIKNAFAGIFIGLILFIAAFPLLWWNEGNSLKTIKMLQEVAGNLVNVGSDTVEAGNDGKLIHVSGPTHTADQVVDTPFGISENAIRLSRSAEIYQYEEEKRSSEKKKVGGGTTTETTYTYQAGWHSGPIDSSSFKDPTYKNKNGKGEMPYKSQTFSAHKVGLGAYQLNDQLIGQIDNWESYSAKPEALPGDLAGKPHQGGYYFGENPAKPAIGDVKVMFRIVKPSQASVIAQQLGDSFQAYTSEVGKTFEKLTVGLVSAGDMIAKEQSKNKFLTWAIRLGGFFLMFLGMCLVFKPLSVLADVIPPIGSLIGMGTGFVAGILAFTFSTLTIGVAWVRFRPLIGIPLLVLSIGSIVLLSRKNKKTALPAGAGNAPPPPADPPPPPPPPPPAG
jgi:hypothetical protein